MIPALTDPARTPPIAAFIARWRAASGSERANYQLFVTELCDLLGTPKPDPASDDTRDNACVFERRVQFAHGDGSQSSGFIDCYQRGRFALEAKKVRAGAHTKGFDDALLRARAQDVGYQLDKVQRGQPPDDVKPTPSIGRGVEEIRVWDEAGTFRIVYTARLADAVVVLHAFQKKTQTTPKRDIELAKARFAQLMRGDG